MTATSLPLCACRPAVPRWVWGWLVLLHLLALGWQLCHRQPFFPDSDRYVQAARNLRDAGVLYALPLSEKPLQLQEYSIRPPAYPVWLWLTGGAGQGFPWGTLLLQNLLSLLNLGLALRWLVAQTGGLNQRQWALVLLLTAAAPAQFIYANVLMSEVLLQTAVVGLWLSLVAFCTEGWQARHLAWAAGATMLALLTKPVFGPFALLLLVLVGVISWRQRRPWLVVVAALPVVATLGWMARNEARTGYFHFSSITEINLLRYNVRGVLQTTEGPAAAEKFVHGTLAAANQRPTFAEQQQYVQHAGMAALLRHPVAYTGQHLRGMLTLLLDPGRFDAVHFLRLSQPTTTSLLRLLNQGQYIAAAQQLQQLPVGLLLGLGLIFLANVARLGLIIRFGLTRVYPRAMRLVILGLVAYVALLTGPLGAARFVVPILPLLLAAAGAGLPATRHLGRV
ncbi:hypothetical protein [Hymenobacter pini]|uniref:hypothetical protein n=1 Tax=Hymenobacter pini TaxID=2880879 RepID=UPI001CF3DD2B|nr:hypothetical protein [Hymenobacter pini]MCA8832817.1 hypothetical protein [Hymenobacter pini]